MSRLHRIRPLATFVAALALFTFALAVSPHGAARAATPSVTYTIASAAFTTSPCDVPPCQILSYSFTGTGTTTTAGAPAAGTFSWTFIPSKFSNSNACAATQGSGTMQIIWQDNTETDVSFSFKARDAHTWAIKGQVSAGTTTFPPNPIFPPSPNTPAQGTVGLPPNPCTGTSVPATISLFPPAPV